jgi:hypothetical protein
LLDARLFDRRCPGGWDRSAVKASKMGLLMIALPAAQLVELPFRVATSEFRLTNRFFSAL